MIDRYRMVRGALLAIAALSLMPAPLVADWHGRRSGQPFDRGERPGGFVRDALERLDLTAGQQARVDEILEGRRDEARAARERLRASRRELQELARDPQTSARALERAAAAIGDAEAALVLGHVTTLREVRALLTDEQRARLDALHEERRASRRHHRHHGSHPHGDDQSYD
jgi:Spy/CpxP family protein refolding chaperone